MPFLTLSHAPHLLPVVARWYFDTWGHRVPGWTLEDEQQRLEVFLHDNELPVLLMATDNEVPVAAAQLKFHERTERPERLHWLGGVYVCPSHRGHALASDLIAALMQKAQGYGVREVFLQTEHDDGGLYAQLGWEPLERQTHRTGVPVRIMRRVLPLARQAR
ncbi:GNAT family N-acetyltransferase [Stenotrophomonas rhizophila]|jgi:GNAT superfamily N-acetyltransferase|uniref:GNAT family N-acetyltransferase n=1 Tax=Stenotrophomonas rhizophila TaxID=216778 RepID=UPI000B89413F|nr:GNAT family N-acetyltransferase [Stenotrophomonas rhizophila]